MCNRSELCHCTEWSNLERHFEILIALGSSPWHCFQLTMDQCAHHTLWGWGVTPGWGDSTPKRLPPPRVCSTEKLWSANRHTLVLGCSSTNVDKSLCFLISKMGTKTWPLRLCTVTVRISVFTRVKAANFSQRLYGPIAGALASKNNTLIGSLQNVAFDLVSR